MRGRIGYLGIPALVAPMVSAAAPQDNSRLVSLPAQSLSTSLQAVAKRFGVELLFSQDMVAARSAPAVNGRVQVQQALDLVLSGSNLGARKTGEGSYIIAAASVAADSEREATPDILVIGRRTQNADIRRTQNDVRPYQVISRRDIASSHVATIEELAAKRLPANAQGASLSQQGAAAEGETASSINLRGLGTDQTLILVDGRRLPLMPSESGGFSQSDVNAIPPEAIERVEAITATAGGVYGPGANAGVINLVMRRDYRGVDLAVAQGITARGDAPYRRADLRVGFTPDGGATDIMIDASLSDFGGLDVGARDFQQLANERSFANGRAIFLLSTPPPSNSLNVVSGDGSNLVFKPSYGGASLGSSLSFMPPADGRTTSALVQTLTANAGRLDLTPAATAGGGGASLLSARRTSSIIASARHQFGNVELFADYLRLVNRGHASQSNYSGQTTLAADDPGNPFVQEVTIYAPDPDLRYEYDFRTEVTRTTFGVIVDLPGRWRGNADYTFGLGRRSSSVVGRDFNFAGLFAYYSSPYGSSDPRNPLVNYSNYASLFNDLLGATRRSFQQENSFHDASLRLAGPLFRLGDSDLSATLQAERRSERVAGGSSDGSSALAGVTPTQPLADYGQVTRSVYGELRAPLVDAQSGIRPLRGLEVQLAIRRDETSTQALKDYQAIGGGGTRLVYNAGTVFTAGLKVSPVAGVLLRGSIATGEQALSVSNLTRFISYGGGVIFVPDPKRGNVPGLYTFDTISGGPLHPKPAFARSLSLGAVIQPLGVPGLRLSLDYTHITKHHETVNTTAAGANYFFEHEDLYPDRVVRAPLTPEDAAKGYTAGLVTSIDTSSLQIGTTVLDAVDGQIDYRLPIRGAGTLELRAAATWQPHFTRTVGFGVPDRDYSDRSEGTPRIRANAGARWTLGPLSLTLDGQLTSGYRISSALEYYRAAQETVVLPLQGSDRVPTLATLDVGAEYRFSMPRAGMSGRARTLAIRFGVQDVLDSHPATDITSPGDYNSYADPRRRRFELTLAAGL